MDVTAHDLNLQMQQLISDFKKTGNEHYKLDAEYLRSEFETWWNDEVSLFAPPAETWYNSHYELYWDSMSPIFYA